MAELRPLAPLRLAVALVALVFVLGACSDLQGAPPEATPQDFPGIANQLTLQGLTVGRLVSGDAGCDDPTLIPTAIGFDLSGLGVASPLRARVYIFGDRAAYDRRRADVDACVAKWSSDPATLEFVDAPPFVLAVQGPLPPAFKTAVVRALNTAAGTGG